MIRNSLGTDYGYLPILHPVGMPQSMMMDYNNFLGRGPTSLYITGYCPIYYVYVAPSLHSWMQNHASMLSKNYYEISETDGAITSWFNVEKIYESYNKAFLQADDDETAAVQIEAPKPQPVKVTAKAPEEVDPVIS